ncbi:TPA: hypothetical protein MIO72_09730 [Klebsiella pneumoniae subsp. pneumoniae]|nr:hypothetical protein AM382_20495 [Klebsiella pneumoniae]PZA42898.1 hypothetical protein C3J79_13470 [Klebsiella pneumoniae subsp. pneumoniae]AYW27499.1 hypothetical protein DPQ49_16755 [Klebsiella pneumoniae]AZZ34855.1 hypothetical protein CY656_16110 [Klebsiella pneumoniae]MBM5757900.1 hypothetical protein [Klebsiella pneumoniae]
MRAGSCLHAGWRLTPYPAYGPAGERGTRRPGKRSAAGRSTLERVLSLCRMAASPYPANGSAGDHRTRRPGKRSAAGQKR